METQRNPLLNWPYYYQSKSIEELKHSLICTTLELETTRLAAQEEIRKKEEQLTNLRELFNKALSERDEAQENYKALFLEKLLIQQQTQQIIASQVHSGSSSSIEDEPTITKKGLDSITNGGNISSSDCDESIISSPSSPPPPPSSALPENALQLLSSKKQLPEKGKLLQAVIKAGPLLQTLLLAGPLPQWRHPPPPLENLDIPPVTIAAAAAANQPVAVHHNEGIVTSGSNVCGTVNRKRGFIYAGFDGSTEASKYQRVLLH